MDYLLDAIRKDLLDPKSLIGALFYGVVFIGLATVLAVVIRRSARRVEPRLSDTTGLRFASAFAQVLTYLVGFILYAHLVPELHSSRESASFPLFWGLLLRAHLGILSRDCRWCSTDPFE
jgi:predicted membrane channel-forming protein YqfA (hemolysin III family)